MANVRQYQTYFGVHLVHWEQEWGNIAYNKMLTKSLPVADDFIETEDYTAEHNASFLYPLKYLNAYYLDGLLEGWFSIYNSNALTTYDIESYTVKLQKSNNIQAVPTDLVSYTNTLSTVSTVPTESYLTMPIYVDINHQLIEENEKLILYVEITATTDTDTPKNLSVAHANTTTGGVDLQIKIPYAPEG